MIVPIAPANVTVLGARWTRRTRAWQGLDFTRATLRNKSSLMVALFGEQNAPDDHHLSVPFRHPDDPDDPVFEVPYRVRPRRNSDRFEQVDGVWMLRRAAA